MTPREIAAGLALAACLATPALAVQVHASDPDTLMDFFFNNGVPAQLSADNVGDPFIEFRYQGETMQLFFYDCTDNMDCQSLQFYSGYRTDDSVGLDIINAWNTENRFVRAYLTDDGAARIEMDIFTGVEGLSDDDLLSLFNHWTDSVGEFETKIGW